MSDDRVYTLGCEAGSSPVVGGLLGMLERARETTLDAVAGMTTEQLDHRFDAESNSIGALLLHIAALEVWYQVNTFEERAWTPAEERRWQLAFTLGPGSAEAIRGLSLDDYAAVLSEVRRRTEKELRSRD